MERNKHKKNIGGEIALHPSYKGIPKKLRLNLKKNLWEIKQGYIVTLELKKVTGFQEILLDNYYLLEREAKQTIKDLAKMNNLPLNKSGLPNLFELFVSVLYKSEEPINFESINQTIAIVAQERELESAEFEALSMFIKAAIIHIIAGALYIEDPGQKIQIMRNMLISLRELSNIDFDEVREQNSKVDQILTKDPAGIYSQMDEKSRKAYCRRVAQLAVQKNCRESEIAQEVLKKAQAGTTEQNCHVGFYLVYDRAKRQRNKRKGVGMQISQCILPFAAAVILSIVTDNPFVGLLIYFPLFEALRPICEYFAMNKVSADLLYRLDLKGEIPQNAKTLIVISTLLPGIADLPKVEKRLIKLFHTNGKGAVKICLLTDLKQAEYPQLAQDSTQISASERMIERLNREYRNKFILIVRKRDYCKTQGNYCGYERKRGAITHLIRLIQDNDRSSLVSFSGDRHWLKGVKYLIALDADTVLPIDVGAQMVGTALHPLNKGVYDEERGIVTSGYGIIAPRIANDLSAVNSTAFARIMAGCGGITAYDSVCGDIYQDLFSEGIFAGKGLIDVELFYKVLNHAFPDNRVLSHDILEGCFLRTGFLSDVEMLDGFPSNMSSWYQRLHRWLRGDYQNIPWLRSVIPTENGFQKNPFSPLCKWKLFDNLRRGFTPVISLLCILIAIFTPKPISIVLSLSGLAGAVLPFLISALRAFFAGGMSVLSRKYYSKAIPQALESLIQGILGLTMLPQTAIISADAIIRSVYRQWISHKKLLEWVTAADSERGPHRFDKTFRKYAPSFIIGILILAFSPYAFLRVFGIAFIILMPIAFYSGKHRDIDSRPLSQETRETLMEYAASMWKFYEELCTVHDNYLPPDNIQESPAFAIAHRTSPTNIGFYMLSILAARDFEFIDTSVMASKLTNIISTVESLEKYHGNLYNWYNTKTKVLLHPKYVSTVDSGNFVCLLLALKEGLLQYSNGQYELLSLVKRIEALINQTDLTVFYNDKRKLFSIGYDPQLQELSGSYYDLLMSEARMTSYFAIATGQVGIKHWGALGRTLASLDGYTGSVSWTGTMFEYFMPQLLLPSYEGSLQYETLRFCIYAQKHRIKEKNLPFGISESAYFAFDPQLNYQYKAHGVQKLAFKRGMDKELVVSPYSTFLIAPFATNTAIKNLKLLEEYDMVGRYGFYEAIDFTKSRVHKAGAAIIKNYMAHHIGMSFIALSNLLCDNIMQKRFFQDERMMAASELLQEKIPLGAVVYDDINLREVPEKNSRNPVVNTEFDRIFPQEPRAMLLSNGEMTLVATDVGAEYTMYRGVDITRRSKDLLRRPIGVYVVVSGMGQQVCITSAPLYEPREKHVVEFASDYVLHYVKSGELEAGVKTQLLKRMPCLLKSIALKNHSNKKQELELLIYLEPSLTKYHDDIAHPAFSRLFLQAEKDSASKSIIYSRRLRGEEAPVYLAVGFTEEIEFEYETVRDKILTRPHGIKSIRDFKSKPFTGNYGTPDGIIAIRFKVTVLPHDERVIKFVMTTAATKWEAIRHLVRIRQNEQDCRFASSALMRDDMESRLAYSVVSKLLFPKRDSRENIEAQRSNMLSFQSLWSLGISGDYPIVLLELLNDKDTIRLESYLRMYRLLRNACIYFDLVVAYREGGDYASPISNTIRDVVDELRMSSFLAINSGIHLIDLNRHSKEMYTLLCASAQHIVPKTMMRVNLPALDYYPEKFYKPQPITDIPKEAFVVHNGYFTDGSFTVTGNPKRPFCNILANRTFGTLMSDKALGFTWAINSRENKLTPWYNDTMSDNKGEMLLLRLDGKIYDLIDGSTATFRPEETIYQGSINNDITYTVSVTVPDAGMVKYCALSLQNNSDKELEIECAYYTEPVLSVNRESARHITAHFGDGELILENSYGSIVKGVMVLTEQHGADSFTCDRAGFLCGRWNEQVLAPLADPCGAVIVKRKLPPRRQEDIRFILSFAQRKSAACRLATKPVVAVASDQSVITVNTPDKALNLMVNTWLPWQILGSRVLGRTSFYQCGGAWGFRDQLQDVMAVLLFNPRIAYQHIIRAASHQFIEGDVLHWWHKLPNGMGTSIKGVRTRYSDDLLWLPLAVCEYIEKMQDFSILTVKVRYLWGEPLTPDQHEKYFEPQISEQSESLFMHCVRAIEKSFDFGDHGINKIGGGDWNDGFNKVGAKGIGESVWLSMFLCHILERFIPLCKQQGDEVRAEDYAQHIIRLKQALDENCWDGSWYLRAFYDDGGEMGSKTEQECQIDSLPQSFSVISGMPDKERRNMALDSALERLVDKQEGIIRLFTPAFHNSEREPGYIKAYPPGIRENGGQYTHGAIWFCLALLMEGRIEDGYELIKILNPIEKTMDKEKAIRYGLEPYLMPADIYTNDKCYGMGGWSMYTGAAGWYYRTIIEFLLGIKLRGDKLFIQPKLPQAWDGYTAKLRFNQTDVNVTVKFGDRDIMMVDGQEQKEILLNKHEHQVNIVIKR